MKFILIYNIFLRIKQTIPDAKNVLSAIASENKLRKVEINYNNQVNKEY